MTHQSTATDEKLKPCPFCKCEARKIATPEIAWHLPHKTGCFLLPTTDYILQDGVIAWNQRASLDALPREVLDAANSLTWSLATDGNYRQTMALVEMGQLVRLEKALAALNEGEAKC